MLQGGGLGLGSIVRWHVGTKARANGQYCVSVNLALLSRSPWKTGSVKTLIDRLTWSLVRLKNRACQNPASGTQDLGLTSVTTNYICTTVNKLYILAGSKIPHMRFICLTHTHTHTHTHITGERQSRPVLTATSQSNGNGRTSTLTETKPLNRLRKNFAQLIKSTRRTRNPKLEPIGRKGASGEYVKFFINFLFLFFPGLA